MAVALVSGANRGTGREIARQLRPDHGFVVLAGARDPEQVEEADETGSGRAAYRLSKTALNALTRTTAAEEPGIIVNTMRPGWVRTHMGGPSAPLR